MATRNTRTAFTDANGNNTTQTGLATSIVIKAGPYIVGAIKSLDINEKRNVKMIDEVGTDGHIDSAPTSSTDISGSCTRIRFAKMRIAEAFARSFVHVSSQRIPFDIEMHDLNNDSDTNNAVITTLHNVWITSISYGVNSEDWIISDKMDFVAESISSIVANKNVVTGVANGQDGPIVLNKFEREADRGLYRGSLDAAGLINAFLDDPVG